MGAMEEMEGVVFAFRNSLTPSECRRRGNLCGQETPRGSDMCSYSAQVRKK